MQRSPRRRKAEIELSGVQEARVSLSSITADATGSKYIEESLFRANFEQNAGSSITRCRISVEQVMKDVKLSASDIGESGLAGGTAKAPVT